MPRVHIPALLRTLTGGAPVVDAEGQTVAQLLDDLERRHPGLRARLTDGGSLQAGLAVAVDGNVATRGLQAKVASESEVHFLPAISGG